MSEETNNDQDFIAAPSPADTVVGKPPEKPKRARVEDAVDLVEHVGAVEELKRFEERAAHGGMAR